jgi:hypothetical protein
LKDTNQPSGAFGEDEFDHLLVDHRCERTANLDI